MFDFWNPIWIFPVIAAIHEPKPLIVNIWHKAW